MYYIYVVRCADGTFYTGITTDLKRRLMEHNEGTASKYTRPRRPVRMVYSEKSEDRSSATKRELEIKSWNRKKKLELIETGILIHG
ncbi:GIY-YIG nuclease family protein [Alkalibacter rhizosphaerae]|uniref:GIY-YIG nuclease family protein n=1 Tax=Alkalibacter rhizosphaerae TaxID=2815577 RepID=UPI001FF00D66|nr:GIY-YIG nuclease family protein [Alkalibacter rhizosphaerae]